MKKNTWKIFLMIFALSFSLMFCLSTKAEAAVRELEDGKTYQTRLTGTKMHKIKCVEKEHGELYSTLYVYVDGKKSTLSKKNDILHVVQLAKLSPTRTLLCVTSLDDKMGMNAVNIYEYKGGKFVLLKNLCSLSKSTGSRATKLLPRESAGFINSASGNKIVMTWFTDTPMTGFIGINVTYQVKKNTITLTSSYGSAKIVDWDELSLNTKNPKWTATKTLTTYTTIGGRKKAFTVKKNQKVTLKQMTVKNGKRYLKLTNSQGKSGWIENKGTTSPFREAVSSGSILEEILEELVIEEDK